DGQGTILSNFYWNYPWAFVCFSIVLILLLAASHRKKSAACYESVVQCGYWLLTIWFGGALIANEISFTPWFSLSGEHF
ncbi:MAG: hypothetical protein ABIQ35_02380, partial [Verrucomicrobiota bacterium]